jgi:CheY-like chemotaxis protein
MNAAVHHEVTLVLVEDDDVDAETVVRAFARERVANVIHRTRDGAEALELLMGGDGRPALERPYIILLDIRMPRMDGLQFLTRLRETPELADSVVFVLTTSDDDRDIMAAYDHNVAGYLVKSRAGADFVEIAKMIDLYWRYVEFPPGARG